MKQIYKRVFSPNLRPMPTTWRQFKYSMTLESYHSYSDKDIRKLFTSLVKDLNK